MKLHTSIKNALTVADRVRAVNGILATPCCRFPAIRISRVWLFGSTVKFKDEPNDTDLLIEYRYVGDRTTRGGGVRYDRQYLKSYGVKSAIDSVDEMHKYLRGRLKMVRLHSAEVDGPIAYPRVLLYPRNDLPNS